VTNPRKELASIYAQMSFIKNQFINQNFSICLLLDLCCKNPRIKKERNEIENVEIIYKQKMDQKEWTK
jgi:hypothetical protein